MSIPAEHKELLRELARQVKDIAANSIWKEKQRLWKAKNALKPVRPLILCSLPEAAWEEIIPRSSLTVQEPFFRKYELELRRKIYRWDHIKDDEIITDTIYVPIAHSLTDWIEGRKRPFSNRADCAAAFSPSIHEYSDLKKLKLPQLTVDRKKTQKDLAAAYEVFGDVLQIQEGEPFYSGSDSEVMGWGNGLRCPL